MRIVAVMPIKLTNERLPGKNIKMLGEKPLLRYELDSLLNLKELDEIIVYCSDESIKPYLPDGVGFRKRPLHLDLPASNFTQIFECFMKEVPADIYLYAHATAPYIKVSTMHECLSAVLSGGFDSAFCAVEIKDYLWKGNKPLNFDAADIPRSQDLEPIYRETSGIYVFTESVFRQYRRRVGNRPYIKNVTFRESIDINEPEDFKMAEMFLNVHESLGKGGEERHGEINDRFEGKIQ